MREKTFRLMANMLVPFEQSVENITADFRGSFQRAFDELPPEIVEATATVEKSLRESKAELENRVAEIIESHLTADEVAAILAYQESPAYKRLSEVSMLIQEAVGEASLAWQNTAIKRVEPDLQRLLGVPEPPPPTAAEAPTATDAL